jgi:DNA-binding LytR/AlgR family response regulator
MIDCIIVEDDKIAAQHLQRLVEKENSLTLHGVFYNVADALKYLSEEVVDLIFLDIEMPDATGFDLLDQLPYRPYIILTTSKTEYAFTAFQYSVTDYLKKPITIPRFKESVEKIKPLISKQKANLSNDIFIKTDGKLICLHNDDIRFIEAVGDYVKFVTDQKTFLSLATLKSIEEKLNHEIFLKVHRSYIVNTKKITDIEDNTILMGKNVIPISKAHRKIVMEKLNII